MSGAINGFNGIIHRNQVKYCSKQKSHFNHCNCHEYKLLFMDIKNDNSYCLDLFVVKLQELRTLFGIKKYLTVLDDVCCELNYKLRFIPDEFENRWVQWFSLALDILGDMVIPYIITLIKVYATSKRDIKGTECLKFLLKQYLIRVSIDFGFEKG